MIKPSDLFKETKEVIEVVEDTISDKHPLEENMSLAVSVIDGAFKTIQEHILTANKQELDPYKNQLLEVYNVCYDLAENQLPRFKRELIKSDIKTDTKIGKLREEVYNTLEERLEETKETIQVYFREEVKELKLLRSNIVQVEKYIKENASSIVDLREEVFAQLRESNSDSEVNQIVIQDKLEEISKEYETLSEGLLNEPPTSGTGDPLMDQNFVTLDQLQSHYKLFVNRVTQQLSTLGGGGEVRLEFLDDIDRSTALIDGRVLKYDASVGIWTGAVVTGGGGGGFSGNYNDLTNTPVGIVTDGRGTVGQLLQHNGSSFVGISSETYSDFVTDCGQGYYAYTTDFYTVGVANTTQELSEDTWNLLQPQVAATYNHQTHQMQAANSGNPYVGSGATIGTGQTTFSLAGMGAGANCLVRVAFRFTPDVDDSDMDIRLKFTTNTATQGTGLTNFTIAKQALLITQGADEEYPGEILIPFFVGDTLSGTTIADAGKFTIEANPSDEGDLEILAVTVAVDN